MYNSLSAAALEQIVYDNSSIPRFLGMLGERGQNRVIQWRFQSEIANED